MNPYDKEVLFWETKPEYYQMIRASKDVDLVSEKLSNQTKAMLAAQFITQKEIIESLTENQTRSTDKIIESQTRSTDRIIESQTRSTDRIIESQDRIQWAIQTGNQKLINEIMYSTQAIITSQSRIASEISNLSYDVRKGFIALKASFEWGISEVVWQLEQNTKRLDDIVAILMAPLDTQAKELKQRAIEAYANEWWDDALSDFLESETKNRYDFSIHMSIGIIYMFKLIDKNKALEYFEKAYKYAKPKSSYYAAMALLYKGLVYRDFSDWKNAVECTEEAIKLFPEISEAYYQNAQYNAQLGNISRAMETLEIAIEHDKFYMPKANKDPMFFNVRKELTTLFIKMRDEKLKELVDYSDQVNMFLSNIGKNLDILKSNYESATSVVYEIYNDFNAKIARISKLIPQPETYQTLSYFDTLAIIDEIQNAIKTEFSTVDVTYVYDKNTIESLIGKYSQEERKIIAKIEEDYSEKESKISYKKSRKKNSILHPRYLFNSNRLNAISTSSFVIYYLVSNFTPLKEYATLGEIFAFLFSNLWMIIKTIFFGVLWYMIGDKVFPFIEEIFLEPLFKKYDERIELDYQSELEPLKKERDARISEETKEVASSKNKLILFLTDIGTFLSNVKKSAVDLVKK